MNYKFLITITFSILWLGMTATAQDGIHLPKSPDTSAAPETSIDNGEKNIIKLNVAAIVLNNYSLQYERLVAPRVSIALGVSHRAKGGLPLLSSFESLIDDAYTFQQIQNITVSNTAFTPEVRFYLGQRGSPSGFYIAPYLRVSTYQLGLGNFEYTVEYQDDDVPFEETKHIDLTGNLRTTTGGILLGAQWRLNKLLYLDWWMLGAAYGGANGKLTALSPLDPEEQLALQTALQDLEIPMVDSEVTVDGSGARIGLKGPWTGLRTGISLGIRF